MEVLDSKKIISDLIYRAKLLRGNYGNFCESSGIDNSWFSKFVNGKIKNPTIDSLARLDKAIVLWNEQ